MSKVVIEKPEGAREAGALADEANTINGRIRDRAFELFEQSGEPKHRHSRNHLAAIGARRVFQRFDLPDSIDTSSVRATFENGLLTIKANLAQPKPITAGSQPVKGDV